MTPEERYDLAEKTADGLVDLVKNLGDIGIYDENEYNAVTSLVLSLGRAMKVLDPEKYQVRVQAIRDEFARKHSGELITADAKLGQYL